MGGKRFILVNESGEALEGTYMEFLKLPTSGELGHAVYVDSGDTVDKTSTDGISFEFRDDGEMICWYMYGRIPPGRTRSRNPFAINIKKSDTGEAIGLAIQYPDGHVVTFTLERVVAEDAKLDFATRCYILSTSPF